MILCGVKISHDGGIAVIDGRRLAFSIEVEKLGNAARYSELGDLNRVGELLDREGLDLSEVDQIVVDGWFQPQGRGRPLIPTTECGRPLDVPVAPYGGDATSVDPLHRYIFGGVGDGALKRGYVSYRHASSHVAGAYCSSPFADDCEDALVLVWDGGMVPRLYLVDASGGTVTPIGSLFPIVGNTFASCCLGLGPFLTDLASIGEQEAMQQLLGVAGKAMAYAALGRVETSAYPTIRALLGDQPVQRSDSARRFGATVAERKASLFAGMSDADIIATFQAFLGTLIVEQLDRLVRRFFGGTYPNLCMAGGCALNIKWNSQVRAADIFEHVWVPPFANDSGAAIGTACCELMRRGQTALDWSVYSGPRLDLRPPRDWSARPCGEGAVARILHEEHEPVVVLAGRAELGPRALGNRSILAPATDPAIKDRLNAAKDRAGYRPVAPVCLASRARTVFDPGGDDPYMLFEHRVRREWEHRLPAIMHLDGTARLQTVAADARGTPCGRILERYELLSGIPVLCNTSANRSGCGFFSDAAAAAAWGRIRHVWTEGTLYTDSRGS